MKNSMHNIKHKAKKAIRQATVASNSTANEKMSENQPEAYYNYLYASRPSIYKSALAHFLKETKRHKKMAGKKKHAKRSTPGQVSEDHPFTKIEHNPNHFIKQKQMQINEASNLASRKIIRKKA